MDKPHTRSKETQRFVAHMRAMGRVNPRKNGHPIEELMERCRRMQPRGVAALASARAFPKGCFDITKKDKP